MTLKRPSKKTKRLKVGKKLEKKRPLLVLSGIDGEASTPPHRAS